MTANPGGRWAAVHSTALRVDLGSTPSFLLRVVGYTAIQAILVLWCGAWTCLDQTLSDILSLWVYH